MKSYKSIAVVTSFSLIAKVLGVAYKLVLVSLIGTIGMGYYQLVYPLFVFVFTLLSSGVATAITMYIADKENSSKSYILFKKVLLIVFALSLFVAVIMCFFSRGIAKLQGNEDIQLVYYSVAVAIILVSLLSLYKGFLRGLKKIVVYSVAEIIEQLSKVGLSIVFAIILRHKGVLFSVAGIFMGIALSCFISIIFIRIIALKNLNKINFLHGDKIDLKSFFKCSIGLTITLLIIPITQFIDSFIVVNLLVKYGESINNSTILFGLSRGVVSAIVSTPMVLVSAIEFVMLPSIMNCGDIKMEKCRNFIFLTYLVIVPISSIFYFFSGEILSVLYGSTLTSVEVGIAENLLKIGALEVFLASIVSLQNVVFQSEKNVKLIVFSMIVASGFKILFEIIFIKYLSIYYNLFNLFSILSLKKSRLLNPAVIKRQAAFPLVSHSILALFFVFFNIPFTKNSATTSG